MPTEKAIRIFRKKCETAKIKERCRELEFYEKPTAKRKRKAQAAHLGFEFILQRFDSTLERFEKVRPAL